MLSGEVKCRTGVLGITVLGTVIRQVVRQEIIGEAIYISRRIIFQSEVTFLGLEYV